MWSRSAVAVMVPPDARMTAILERPSSTATDEPVQLLTPEGELVEHPDYPLDLSDGDLRAMFTDLLLVRRVDEEATALQRQGELGIYISLLGQEGAQIGAGRALRPQDTVFPSYREHGIAHCRGIDPMDVIAFMRGAVLGGRWNADVHRFFKYQIVIGTQALHATGYAMGVQRDGKVGDPGGEAVLCCFGDGATSQGDVNEAFVWASTLQVPVVFFCQNNQWGISTPSTAQSRIPLYRRAAGFGFPGVRVDGNDVLASYAVTRDALDRARRGDGPTFVEAYTYRMGAHTTSDDPSRYRLSGEVELWKLKDPLARVRSFLIRQQFADRDFFDEVDARADELCARVRTETLSMRPPAAVSLFDHVHVDESPLIAEERAAFLAYEATFAD